MNEFKRWSFERRRQEIFDTMAANPGKIYSVRDFADFYGVHKDTIRRTLDELVSENLIIEGEYQRPGKTRAVMPFWFGYRAHWMYLNMIYASAMECEATDRGIVEAQR